MIKLEIIPGDKFGSVTILSESEKKGKMRYFNVECGNCGKVFEKAMNSLFQNKLGCSCNVGRTPGIKNKIQKEYRLNERKLLKVFKGINYRCSEDYKSNRSYIYYAGKGIKCEWNSFEEFYKDMGDSYKEGLSIDRIDNNLNYCKGNCRWADIYIQNNNRSNNIIVEGGITLKQWTNQFTSNKSAYSYATKLYKEGVSLHIILEKIIAYKPYTKVKQKESRIVYLEEKIKKYQDELFAISN